MINLRGSINNNKLTGDYEMAYQDIIGYLHACNISPDSEFSAEVQEDMKDMLLSAQKNQLPVNNIIGEDIKTFCEDIVKSHNTKRVKLLQFLKRLNFNLAFLAIISMLFKIFNMKIDLSIIIVFFLTWLLFQYIANFFYKKLCLKFKGLKNKIKCLLLISLVCLLVLFPLILLITKYCDLIMNGYYVTAICLLFVLVIHYVCRRLDKNIRWYSYLR